MSTELAKKVGSSGAEARFVDLFCEVFGPEAGQYVYTQYPFVDIYGGHRSIDYALKTPDGRIAIEVDGNTWHDPGRVSTDKYHDDLLKQNCMVHDGWRVFRWTSQQIEKTPERVSDELVTFIGTSPFLQYIEDYLPEQKGQSISLMEHQFEALQNLKAMRDRQETIALLYHATGTGKTVTAVSDAKAVGKRTLFLAHTKELVYQAYEQFRRIWPEVQVGRYVEAYRESEAFVVCGSVQSIAQNLDDLKPDDFGYLVIDECHHGTADSYKRILSFFKPEFTLGLTATPERADGEDLLAIFKNIAHKLDLKTAVELGSLAPVRCIRVKTNIDLRDVRINGFQYNALDLNTKVIVPERNKLIVDTWIEYAKGKQTVVFCTSVLHANEIAALFQAKGVDARSVSGSTKPNERKQVLSAYERGDIPVLCACDLLNEGWDSPHTQVLFMARPTMSRTIYMQQLGRGMRTCAGKECLLVFDFVDNANMFNMPFSLHRLLCITGYRPSEMVLGTKAAIKWDNDMFAKGEKPAVLIDYPISATDYEHIDLFNWQDQAKDMVSQIEFTRRVSAQSETIERYIRDGKIVSDLEVPIGEKRSFRYFFPETVERYAKEFGWTLITSANMKDMFMDMIRTMTMSYSYKPVFLKSFFDNMGDDGTARLEDVVAYFADYYESRLARRLLAERKPCIFTKGGYTDKDVERLILSMPFKRFEDMHFIRHAKHLGVIQLDRAILRKLTDVDKSWILEWCDQKLEQYFEEKT